MSVDAHDEFDHEHSLLHLTPNGWVWQDRPHDQRVETWRRTVHRAAGWGRRRIDFTCQWSTADWTREQRDAVRQAFPLPDLVAPASIAQIHTSEPI